MMFSPVWQPDRSMAGVAVVVSAGSSRRWKTDPMPQKLVPAGRETPAATINPAAQRGGGGEEQAKLDAHLGIRPPPDPSRYRPNRGGSHRGRTGRFPTVRPDHLHKLSRSLFDTYDVAVLEDRGGDARSQRLLASEESIHRCRNLLATVPAPAQAELRDAYWAIFDTDDLIADGHRRWDVTLNQNRLHSSLQNVPPIEYETEYYRRIRARQQPLPGELSLH
jgi:hypothetical protein